MIRFIDWYKGSVQQGCYYINGGMRVKVLYVIDTGANYDRPIQKGQWTLGNIPSQGSKIINEWLKEKTEYLVKELRYAELSGTGKIEVKKLSDDYDIEVTVSVKIKPADKSKRRAVVEQPTKRRALQ